MHILFTAATPFELLPLQEYLKETFKHEHLQVDCQITGVGQALTAYHTGIALAKQSYDLVINAGIAGAYHDKLQLGDVVCVQSERFADLGVEEADGTFTDVHELGLIDSNNAPFQNGQLLLPQRAETNFLPKVDALTVNKVHGTAQNIEAIRKKYQADIESMEGAAFFYACLQAEVPFLQIRAISNYVEPRNRDNWNLPLAITQLNQTLIQLLNSFV